jgi:hypothetical protein
MSKWAMWPVIVSRHGKSLVLKRVIMQILIPCQMFWKKNISITLCKIWVAKAATAGGASGSTRPILEALFGSSKVKGAVLFQQNST